MYSDAISDDSPSTHILRLKNLSELNLTASYLPNKTIQAYVKLNNLLDRQQELYYGYPLLGFHALLGVNLSF
jgi:outer membrane cobalamin receptor